MHTQETTIYSVILMVVLVVAIIIGYYVYTILLTQKQENERKRNYMFSEMVVLERERERIAHELHDSAGPNLSLLKLNLDELNNLDEKNSQKVKDIKIQIDEIIMGLRETSHALTPTVLVKSGLIVALEKLAENLSDDSLQIIFVGEVDNAVGYDIAIHIYRILEQFIFNTIKHAEATQIKIIFEEKDGNYLINARDNGKGFDLKMLDKNVSSLGLKGFDYRTELLGGKFDLYSEEGKGVEIKIAIPTLKM